MAKKRLLQHGDREIGLMLAKKATLTQCSKTKGPSYSFRDGSMRKTYTHYFLVCDTTVYIVPVSFVKSSWRIFKDDPRFEEFKKPWWRWSDDIRNLFH